MPEPPPTSDNTGQQDRISNSAARDAEGWVLDENGNQYGYCNGCGEESEAYRDCCADGEVVPYDS